jgi:hypothetical protein
LFLVLALKLLGSRSKTALQMVRDQKILRSVIEIMVNASRGVLCNLTLPIGT